MNRVLLFGILCSFLLQSCAFVSVPLMPGTQPLTEKTLQGRGRDRILLIDVSGIISEESRDSLNPLSRKEDHVALLKEQLEKAAQDRHVKAVVLRINSPGGTVTACDIMHRELLDFKESRQIPVVACLMGVAASGGYYVALAADSIYAHPTTVAGSIGVIALKFNVKGLLDRVGIVEETITSADLKDSMSPFRGMTAQERAIIQAVLDDMHARFVQVVADGRPQMDTVQAAEHADGRVFTAAQALEAGLVDEIGYLDAAIKDAVERAGLRPDARVVTYHRPQRYKHNIYSQSSLNLISIGGSGIGSDMPLRFMYLWQP